MTIWNALTYLYDNVPIILLIWMLVNLSGVRDSMVLLAISRSKRRAAISRGLLPDGPRVRLANREIRDKSMRLVFHGVGTIIGLMVLLGIPPVWASGWLILTMALVMAITSRLDLIEDREMGELLRHEIGEHSLLPRRIVRKGPPGAQEGT